MTVVRVLIADDHPVVRDGLRGIFEDRDGFEVVGEARDGMEALARVDADVVLMDPRMPRLDGPGATARIAADHPGVKVLVLTTCDGDADIVRAIEAGATGYLLKDAPREELFRAVEAAARGEAVLAPSVAARVMRQLRPGRDEGALSARELEVLALVRRGGANRDIAAALHISRRR